MFGTKISNYSFGQAMGAKPVYIVARVNKELCLTKTIHFVKVLCREFVHGNLFSLGIPAAISSLFANVKVSGFQEFAQSEKKTLFLKPKYTYKRKSDCVPPPSTESMTRGLLSLKLWSMRCNNRVARAMFFCLF